MTRLSCALLAGLALAGCREREERPATAPRVLWLVPAGGDDPGDIPRDAFAMARVEIAADSLSRQQGLMDRDGLAEDGGMLFIYPDERPREFWMMNTRIALSIAYADSRGRIVRILSMEAGAGRPAEALPRYPSGAPAKYALEMAEGWFVRKGIRPGDALRLHPAIAAIRAR